MNKSRNTKQRVVIMAAALAVAVILAGAVSAGEGLRYLADDQGIVSVNVIFKETPRAKETALLQSLDVMVDRVFHFIPVANIKVPQDRLQAVLESLQADPRVKLVEPDGIDRAFEQTVPWGIDRVGAPAVHALGDKGAGVKVAVQDSGIDYTHPDLSANYKGGTDIVNGDADPMDDNGHGTHVSGTIAAIDNSEGVIGVAPEAWLYGVKTLNSSGSGSHENFAAGLEWCKDNGMQVVNYSAGGSDSDTKRLACKAAYEAGILIVAASGNDNAGVGYPAAYDDYCFAVGAIDSTNTRAWFSNFGSQLDVVAPGVGVNSTQMGGGYVAWNGTSMATPHVSGVAALMIANWITGPDVLMQRMRETADDLGAAGFDNYYGYGLVDADEAVEPVATPTPTSTPTPMPTPTPTPTPIPPAVIVCSDESPNAGSRFTARFRLNESIPRPFVAYAVIFMPNGRIINVIPLNGPIGPVARMAGLAAPFEYPLLSVRIPPAVQKGTYEIVVAFFDPNIVPHGRSDAFMEASQKFTVE